MLKIHNEKSVLVSSCCASSFLLVIELLLSVRTVASDGALCRRGGGTCCVCVSGSYVHVGLYWQWWQQQGVESPPARNTTQAAA